MDVKKADQPPQKEEENDSESHYMPNLQMRIPLKADRVFIQPPPPPSPAPKAALPKQKPISKPRQEAVQQQVLQKRRGRPPKNQNDYPPRQMAYRKTQKIDYQKMAKRDFTKTQPKKEKEEYPDLQEDSEEQNHNNSLKRLKKNSLKEEKRRPSTGNQQKEEIKKKQSKMKLQHPPASQQPAIPNKDNKIQTKQPIKTEKKQENVVKKPQQDKLSKQEKPPKPRNEQARRRESSSSSSSDSGSGRHNSKDSRAKRKKQKMWKLKLTVVQKMHIYKRRYLRLKSKFFSCRKCPNDHYMRNLLYDPEVNDRRPTCTKCHLAIGTRCNVFWKCITCNFIVCGKCGLINWRRCPYGHPNSKSDHLKGQKTCDCCLNRQYIGGLTCSCNFEMCPKCQLKSKEFNQRDQEVISLDSES